MSKSGKPTPPPPKPGDENYEWSYILDSEQKVKCWLLWCTLYARPDKTLLNKKGIVASVLRVMGPGDWACALGDSEKYTIFGYEQNYEIAKTRVEEKLGVHPADARVSKRKSKKPVFAGF